MAAKVEPRVPRGMRDILPEQMVRRQYVMDVIRGVFEEFGFEPLQTPALELEETLTGKYGPEAERLIYSATYGGKDERDPPKGLQRVCGAARHAHVREGKEDHEETREPPREEQAPDVSHAEDHREDEVEHAEDRKGVEYRTCKGPLEHPPVVEIVPVDDDKDPKDKHAEEHVQRGERDRFEIEGQHKEKHIAQGEEQRKI